MSWHNPPLRAPGIATLADGEHDGVRWWLQRLDGLLDLQLTVSGSVDENSMIAFATVSTGDPSGSTAICNPVSSTNGTTRLGCSRVGAIMQRL